MVASERLPAAVVDLDAVDHNLAALRNAMGGAPVTLRVASKSLRVPWLLTYLLEQGGAALRGLMTFSAFETRFLAEHGFDDLLLAYPIGRAVEAAALGALAAKGTTFWATVDAVDQVELLARAGRDAAAEIPLCIDLDASWRPAGGRLHFGVRRSPIRDVPSALKLAGVIAKTPGVRLSALLAYEAQIAGMPDTNPLSRHLDPVRRMIKQRSKPVVLERRRQVVNALRTAGHPLDVVNGGGTGSVRFTSADPAVTEVTAGSGFVCSTLFEGYRGLDLRPALFYALSIVRRPDDQHVTCQGGGYISSGPPAADRAPSVHLPKGLQPLGMEGFGEVQTPLKGDASELALGDPVICRPAKAGELAERFEHYLMVRGDEVVARASTYRGCGQTFY